MQRLIRSRQAHPVSIRRHPVRRRLTTPASIVGGVVAAAAGAAFLLWPGNARAADTVGVATLRTADGQPAGTVRFLQEPQALVTRVQVSLALAPSMTGFHGLHLHANDNAANGNDCVADPGAASSTWFVSADGHYRRSTSDVHPHHAGDLPSVWVNRNGTASAEFVIDRIQPGELFNRAVVVHIGADNFGNVPVGDAANQYVPNGSDATTATRNTGNAGDRLACGTVEITR